LEKIFENDCQEELESVFKLFLLTLIHNEHIPLELQLSNNFTYSFCFQWIEYHPVNNIFRIVSEINIKLPNGKRFVIKIKYKKCRR
jgi:hypothetical protein